MFCTQELDAIEDSFAGAVIGELSIANHHVEQVIEARFPLAAGEHMGTELVASLKVSFVGSEPQFERFAVCSDGRTQDSDASEHPLGALLLPCAQGELLGAIDIAQFYEHDGRTEQTVDVVRAGRDRCLEPCSCRFEVAGSEGLVAFGGERVCFAGSDEVEELADLRLR